ncbi:MAG: hypothetical protein AAB416_02815 [Patescibacteria group bacterium]
MLHKPITPVVGYGLIAVCALGLGALVLSSVDLAKKSAQTQRVGEAARPLNERQQPPLPSVQIREQNASDFFVNGILPQQFDSLTVQDLPNVSFTLNGTEVRKYKNDYFFISSWNFGRRLVKADAQGVITAINSPWIPPKGVSEDGYDTPLPLLTGFEVIGDNLFVAASHQGVYQVDLTTNTVTAVYGKEQGLQNLENMALATDGTNLWIGTFSGVGMLEPSSRTIRFFASELGLPCSQFSVKPSARRGEVFIEVTAHDGCSGGLSRYNASSGTWTPYSINAFSDKRGGHPERRIDFNKVIVSDQGIYAAYGGPTFILNKFNEATGRWDYVATESEKKDSGKFTAILPREESYRTLYAFNDINDTGEAENFAIKEFINAAWKLIPLDARTYYALARADRDTVYLMSSVGIEKFTRGEGFPTLLIPSHTPEAVYHRLLLSDDYSHLVYLSASPDEYASSFTDYRVAVANLNDQTAFSQNFHFETGDDLSADDDVNQESMAALSLNTTAFGYEIVGLKRAFAINLNKKTITSTP